MDAHNLELIKENMQPLKSGRKIEDLNATLSMDPERLQKRNDMKS